MIKKLTKTVIVAIATVMITGQTINAQTLFLASMNGNGIEICPNEEGKGELSFAITNSGEWADYTYNLQEGTTAEFTSVANSQSITQNILNLNAEPGTHYYRVVAMNSTTLETIPSNVLTITVYNPLQTGQYDFDEETIGVGSSKFQPTEATGSGNGTLSYQWYKSASENGEYTEIDGANETGYTTPTINTTTYYKRSVYDGCTAKGQAFTKNSTGGDVVKVVVVELDGGEISWTEEIEEFKYCKGQNPKLNIASKTPATGASGQYKYNWVIKDNSNKDKCTLLDCPDNLQDTQIGIILSEGTYTITRQVIDQKHPTENIKLSNSLTIKVGNNAQQQEIENLLIEPVHVKDNIYLACQQPEGYTTHWIINNIEKENLGLKNLYTIENEGKNEIVLETKSNDYGCITTDTLKITALAAITDTIYITEEVEVEKEVEKIVEVPVEKIVEVPVEKIVEVEKIVYKDTIIYKDSIIYIEKMPDNKTAISEKQINFNIWPNPATTFVNADAEEPFSYTLLNNTGIILKKEEGESSYTIDMSEYTDGIYFIKTSDGVLRKIVKE